MFDMLSDIHSANDPDVQRHVCSLQAQLESHRVGVNGHGERGVGRLPRAQCRLLLHIRWTDARESGRAGDCLDDRSVT
jgi:hypothetical protein